MYVMYGTRFMTVENNDRNVLFDVYFLIINAIAWEWDLVVWICGMDYELWNY